MGEIDYFNPRKPNSYRGAYLQKDAKWLKGENSYTYHFPLRKRFPREQVVVSGINAQFQSDLIDVQSISKYNRGFRYICLVIDVFSKFVWLIPIKNKSSENMISAFRKVFKERLPLALQTDRGSEYTNRAFQTFLKKNKVRYFYTKTELKSSIAERYVRTFKQVLYRYFTKNNTRKYIDVLDDMTYSYNHTKHRTIGISPVQVNKHNQETVWQKMYGFRKSKLPTLKVATPVRISKIRNLFEKSSRPNWQGEIFYIAEAMSGNPPMYRLRDYNNEIIDGRFYREEIQPVTEPREWRIEKIIKRRKRGKHAQFLVRWVGYGSEFDSWVDQKDIVQS